MYWCRGKEIVVVGEIVRGERIWVESVLIRVEVDCREISGRAKPRWRIPESTERERERERDEERERGWVELSSTVAIITIDTSSHRIVRSRRYKWTIMLRWTGICSQRASRSLSASRKAPTLIWSALSHPFHPCLYSADGFSREVLRGSLLDMASSCTSRESFFSVHSWWTAFIR